MSKEARPFLKVGVEWIELEIISEADVALTTFGYTPFLKVREIRTGVEYRFYISAKSLAEPLEELRINNNATFKGIQFRVCKDSIDRTAKYKVEVGENSQKRPRSATDIKERLQGVLERSRTN